MRVNLLSKDLEYTVDAVKKIAKWEHLVQLHREDPAYMGEKLTDEHINPEKRKMKVKLAAQSLARKLRPQWGI